MAWRKAASDANAKSEKKASSRRAPKISTIVATVMFIVGLGIIAYPTFSDWFNSLQRARDISEYVAAVQETDTATLDAMMADARAYNERIATRSGVYSLSESERAQYEQLLRVSNSGVIGYVQINSINVNLPIYHGLSEETLQKAIGHMEGTSLPIGGPSTHAVISGHRGLPSARLFTDLDKLEEGDTFSITVLNQTLFYEVDQIRIVLPDDLSLLTIEPGQDYVTLVTCTPYGVNTHRLLVRGHRIEGALDASAITADAVQIPRYLAVLAVGIPILFVFLVGMLVYYRVRKPRVSKQQALNDIRNSIDSTKER